MSTKRIVFMGWHDELPPRAEKQAPADDYDLLRAVMLAEDSNGRWVEFKCQDADHAFKVARKIREERFAVRVVQRGNRLYIRMEESQ